MREVVTVINFESVPIPEIGDYANALLEAGYTWQHNVPDWEAVFAKNVPETMSNRDYSEQI